VSARTYRITSRRKARRAALIACGLLAGAAVSPAGALAATVSVNGATLSFRAEPAGEANAVEVAGAAATGSLSVTDRPPLVAGPGCVVSAANVATCTGVIELRLVRLDARDGDDTLRVDADLPAELDGGEGADSITGGPLADTLMGGPGVDLVSYAARGESVQVTLDGRANDGADGEGDTISPTIENLAGGAGDDLIAGGTGGGDAFRCGSGFDRVVGVVRGERVARDCERIRRNR
jgi:Ca2+-binding RTX toxin-like protein